MCNLVKENIIIVNIVSLSNVGNTDVRVLYQPGITVISSESFNNDLDIRPPWW